MIFAYLIWITEDTSYFEQWGHSQNSEISDFPAVFHLLFGFFLHWTSKADSNKYMQGQISSLNLLNGSSTVIHVRWYKILLNTNINHIILILGCKLGTKTGF